MDATLPEVLGDKLQIQVSRILKILCEHGRPPTSIPIVKPLTSSIVSEPPPSFPPENQ